MNYKIMQLTDLHLGDYPFNQSDKKTLINISKAVRNEKPNLIIISGDIINSLDILSPANVYQKVIDFFNSLKTPIAITYGNHDSEEKITRAELRGIESELKYPIKKNNSYIDYLDRESYTLEIYNGNDLSNVIYIFDSGDEAPKEVGGYAYISLDQINWYQKTFSEYQKKFQSTEDFVFLHIPLPEYWDASRKINEGYFWETDPRIASPIINTGLFMHMYQNNHISGIFCGHDHENNFIGDFLGVDFIYGNVSGYNTYGAIPRGYRIIEINDKSYETYVVYYG